nr:hypothetical protein CFP56_28652 [Quercus suber]
MIHGCITVYIESCQPGGRLFDLAYERVSHGSIQGSSNPSQGGSTREMSCHSVQGVEPATKEAVARGIERRLGDRKGTAFAKPQENQCRLLEHNIFDRTVLGTRENFVAAIGADVLHIKQDLEEVKFDGAQRAIPGNGFPPITCCLAHIANARPTNAPQPEATNIRI